MYRLILYNVIYIAVFWMTTINCLKAKKRTDTKKILKSMPITYETDPAVLEKERRQKMAEDREKLRKKREKKLNRQNEFKDATMTMKKLKEKEMLQEDSTQPTYSDESLEKTQAQEQVPTKPEGVAEKKLVNRNIDDQKEKKSSSHSSEEDLGEVQLVDHDPYAAAKKHIIKKRAQELARKKQLEEAIRRRQERENINQSLVSPDDTLKNISSIQFESQLSVVQRKRRQIMKGGEGSSGESQDGTLVEPKSNELYIRDIPERVME